MSLPSEVLDRIRFLVRAGFDDRGEIIDGILESIDEGQICDGEDIDPDTVEAVVDEAFESHDAEKARWPKTTDCDRLDAAFAALERRGIIALQNAGTTISDGISDVAQMLHEHPRPESLIGYCFYHGQDLERAVNSEGLTFAFGSTDADKEETEGPRIGRIIVEELLLVGFQTKWNGTCEQRIQVPVFDWKRR